MSMAKRLEDYVPVHERLEAFYAKHPDGSVQSEIVELTAERVTVKAYAYRDNDDPRPGIGHSSLGIPGGTPYTRGSEIENAETSAWGRAIAALGFEVKRGIASAEEAQNRDTSARDRGHASASSIPHGPASAQRTPEELTLLDMIRAAAAEHGIGHAQLEAIAARVGVPLGVRADAAQLNRILTLIETPGSGVPAQEVAF